MGSGEDASSAVGRSIVARGRPSDELLSEIRETPRPHLVVNGELGFQGEDLDFLHEVGPLLSGLEVAASLSDDSAVTACTNLDDLSLNTDCTTGIDWTPLGNLRHLFAYSQRWNSSARNLTHLTSLSLYGATDIDLGLVESGSLLAVRLLATRVQEVPSGQAWANVQTLEVRRAPALRDFTAISEMKSLHDLALEKCRLMRDLEPIAACRGLAKLAIVDCGEIDSLTPLQACRDLSGLFLSGSTNVLDGDLSILGALPRLEQAMYRVRKHYRGAPDRFPSQFDLP